MTPLEILQIAGWVELILFVLLVIGSPLELLVHFWAVMNLARVRDLPGQGLTKWATLVGTYVLLRGYLLDFIVNVFWASSLLREWPRQWTVTARLNRHASSTGWRHDRCQLVQVQLLRWFDTKHPDGIHR